jgi:hydroxymethylpyrimidine pyrophosphatase-like HAD family hydrolase
MNFHALATDYDGTLAWHAVVTQATYEALKQFKLSGRKLLLVTGRELPELFEVFPGVGIFDHIVAENGAVLYSPATRHVNVIAAPPPEQFIDGLRDLGVHPLSVGRVIVATQETFHGVIDQAIKDWGLPLQIIPNKGALMILPKGVDKATGLIAALTEMNLGLTQVVGIGDAENDLAFLRLCGCSVAVDNALPLVKEQVQLVTEAARGEGVEEVIARVLRNDLCDVPPQPAQGFFPSEQFKL